MADISAYFYKNNLRTDLQVGRVPVPQQCSTLDHASKEWKQLDCNSNLHMNFYGITLGSKGKIYEVDACANAKGINVFGGHSAWTAVILGRACHALLLEKAEAALAAIDRGEPDESLECVVEATVLMSGLAFESGGLSISHSMTRGLTAVKPWSETLHGFQVAYANLVQIRLEGRPEQEIVALADFYARVGLPRSLRELVATPDDATYDIIAERTMTAPHIRHFPREIGASDIREAMVWVETKFAP